MFIKENTQNICFFIHSLQKKKKKKGSVAMFLKRSCRSEKRGYRMIWPLAMFF